MAAGSNSPGNKAQLCAVTEASCPLQEPKRTERCGQGCDCQAPSGGRSPTTADVREAAGESTLLDPAVCPHGTGSPICAVGPTLGCSPVMSLHSQTSMAGRWPSVSKGAQGSLLTHLPGVRVPSGRGGPLACSLNQPDNGRPGAAVLLVPSLGLVA